MSRNSKSYTRKIQAKAASALRKSGGRGAKQTAPKHNKRRENCLWYQKRNGIDPKTVRRRRSEPDQADGS